MLMVPAAFFHSQSSPPVSVEVASRSNKLQKPWEKILKTHQKNFLGF
jgi:hypothetical protein